MKRCKPIIFKTLFLFLMMALSNCEKDLYEAPMQMQNRSAKKIRYLTGQEAKSKRNMLAKQISTTSTRRGAELSDFGTVKYDVVLEITDEKGNVNTTFRVDHPDETSSKFFNMVLQEKINGETLAKLFEYQMTPEFADAYNKGLKEIKDFQGTYSYRLVAFTRADWPIGYGGNEDGNYPSGGENNPTGGSSYPTGGSTTNSGGTVHNSTPPSGTAGPITSGSTSGGDGNTGGPIGNPHPSTGNTPITPNPPPQQSTLLPCPEDTAPVGNNGPSSSSDNGNGDDGGAVGPGNGNSGSSNNSGVHCFTYTVYVPCDGGGNHYGEEPRCIGEFQGTTYLQTECWYSGGGSNRGGTAPVPCIYNNGAIGFLEPVLTPCEELANLGNPQKANIKPSVDLLKQKVDSNDNTNEIGFNIKKIGNADLTNTYSSINVSSPLGSTEVELAIHFTIIGGGHSHPVGTYPMFSFGDVKFLRDAYNEASNRRKDEVFYILTCKTNTGAVNTYCLKVNNFSALNSKVNEVLDDPTYADINNPKLKMDAIHYNQGLTYQKSNGNLENSFLQQFADFGISTYKATDDTMTHWDKLNLDSQSTPCN